MKRLTWEEFIRLSVEGIRYREKESRSEEEIRKANSQPLPWELPLGASGEKH